MAKAPVINVIQNDNGIKLIFNITKDFQPYYLLLY
jgi:hypothetical protein